VAVRFFMPLQAALPSSSSQRALPPNAFCDTIKMHMPLDEELRTALRGAFASRRAFRWGVCAAAQVQAGAIFAASACRPPPARQSAGSLPAMRFCRSCLVSLRAQRRSGAKTPHRLPVCAKACRAPTYRFGTYARQPVQVNELRERGREGGILRRKLPPMKCLRACHGSSYAAASCEEFQCAAFARSQMRSALSSCTKPRVVHASRRRMVGFRHATNHVR